jgi:hypothetical protein
LRFVGQPNDGFLPKFSLGQRQQRALAAYNQIHLPMPVFKPFIGFRRSVVNALAFEIIRGFARFLFILLPTLFTEQVLASNLNFAAVNRAGDMNLNGHKLHD